MKHNMMHDKVKRRVIFVLPVGLVLTALLGWGCGRHPARAKQQKQEQLAVYPAYPIQKDRNTFTLTEGAENSVTYRTGSLLLLDPAFRPEDLAKMMEIAKAIRLARADAVHYANSAAQKVSKDKEEIAKINAQINQRRVGSGHGVSNEKRLASAGLWFADEMKRTVPDQKRRADLIDTFAGYCEAKIWQLAAQPYFASQKYLTRPTPLALCEKYYQDKGFFSDNAASCAKAQDAGGKYFVQCLWEEGVMKTALFAHHFADKTPQFVNLFSDSKRDDFRKILAAAMGGENATDPLLVSPRLSGKIHTAIMGLRKLNARCNVKLFEIRLGELCTLFVRTNPSVIPEDGRQVATWDIPPAGLIDLVENGRPATDTVGGMVVNLPRAFPLPERSEGQIPYQHLLMFFGARTETSPSESDVIFHTPVLGGNTPANAAVDITSVLNSARSPDDYRDAFGSIYAKTSAEDESVVSGLENKIKEIEDDMQNAETEAGKYDKRVTDLLNDAIKTAKLPNLAHAFINLGLEIIKKTDVYSLEFWFGEDTRSSGDEKKRIKGCYNTFAQTSLAGKECLDYPDYQIAASHFSYKPETGELVFAFPFGEAEAEALGFKAPTGTAKEHQASDYFNDIPLSEFVGTTFEFQLYPNTIGSVVNILTGKAFIKKKDWKEGDDYLYEGVVSIFDNK